MVPEKGRRAEDGPIPAHYRDADATVILILGSLSGGSKLTADLADQLGKPWLHVRLDQADDTEAANIVGAFIARHRVEVLNVAGSRESREPVSREYQIS